MSADSDRTTDFIHQLSDDEQNELRARILRLRSQLAAGFVAKDHIAHLMVLSAIASEPLLLVGAPGAGKSAIVKRFVQLLGVSTEAFFEYVVTPNTQPSELSPLVADGEGSGWGLMTAQVVFLDEVFHANSAVLNPLLRRLNQSEWPAAAPPSRTGVSLLVAATRNLDHPVPNESLLDRFTLQATCDTVHRDRFSDVIRVGTRREVADPATSALADAGAILDTVSVSDPHVVVDLRASAVCHGNAHNQTDAESRVGKGSDVDTVVARQQTDSGCRIDDFALASHCVRARLIESTRGGNDAMDFAHEPGYADFERLIRRLGREDRVFVSDRKLIKLFKLLTTEAWLHNEPQLARSTLYLLSYIGNTADEMQILADKVPLLIDQL